MPTRRAFLAGLAIAALPRLSWADVGNPVAIAAGKSGEAFVLHGLSDMGESLFKIHLPARGHAAAAHPTEAIAVAFARRPGTYALVIDCASGAVLHQLTPPDDRQFNGHGAFSADGQVLMTSEVVAEGSQGRIGLWETTGFRRIGEWQSHGIGPHDIKRLADGRLAVANGGIRTDPSDRTKLNIDLMRPNLSLLSPDGLLLDQVELAAELRQNSIRHLALTADSIAFAMQWEGDVSEAVPQLGLWQIGAPPRLCPPADAEALTMKGYAGSIAAHPTDGRILVTSAPAGTAMIFDGQGQPLTTLHRADVSGVAAVGQGFVLTDGQGALWSCADQTLLPLKQFDTLWDNHLVALA